MESVKSVLRPIGWLLTGGDDSKRCVGHVRKNAVESSAGIRTNDLLHYFAFRIDEEFFWNSLHTEVD